jgi:flagellar assembly protein FliH
MRAMANRHMVFFDRPLGAVARHDLGASVPEEEAQRRIEAAFRRGADQERQAAQQEIDLLRRELAALSSGALGKLNQLETILAQQLQHALPELTLEIARRLLAGFEPPAEMVSKLCQQTLEQLYPERDGLELSLCPRDLELLQALHPDWLRRHHGLRLVADSHLQPGDCVVRSRFGLTDARQKTKLAALSHSLLGA